jgi:Ni/Co efflux regulator RcnB
VLKLFRYLLLATLLLWLPSASVAQDGISQKQQEKNLAKKKKDDKKAKARKEKDDRKRHLEIQDKAARKRIKRNHKRADHGGSGAHRDPWPIRWFVR